MIDFLVNLLAIIVIGIVQISFLPTWPAPVGGLNLILSLVIFLTASNYYKKGLWWAFGGGLFLDLFAIKLFGLSVISLLLTAVLINFLFKNFFTNYSFYSLTVLGVIGTMSYNLMILFFSFLFELLKSDDFWEFSLAGYIHNLWWQVILNLIIMYIVFFIFHLIGKNFRTNFLTSS